MTKNYARWSLFAILVPTHKPYKTVDRNKRTKQSSMKKQFFFVIGFLIFTSCTHDEAQETVKAYIEAHNKHDVKKEVSFYHQDIVFELKNTWTKQGVEEMESLAVWDSTINSNLKLESFHVKGDSVLCKIIENNDWFSEVNIKDLVHDPTIFLVENGKIKKIVAVPSEETGKKIQQTIGSIMQWSQKKNDSTIHKLIPNGQFIYSSDAALKWMVLFKKWKTEQEH